MNTNQSSTTNPESGVATGAAAPHPIQPPKRSLSIEFLVGLFTLAALGAAAYLAVGLGGIDLRSDLSYIIKSEFDNISGLKYGAPVEIAGVPIGEVSAIQLEGSTAIVSLKIRNDVKISAEDTASVRTQGIIGDRYVKISRGSSDKILGPGDTIIETESVVDLEDVIGKVIHSLEGGKDEKDEKAEKSAPSENAAQ